MANSGEVVWVDVLPSLRNFGSELAKSAAGAGTRAGAQLSRELDASAGQAGRRAGVALGSGIEAAKENVKRVAAEIESARNREADAAGKVRVAEARLAEARTSAGSKTSQVAAAEERLATAQRGLTTAQERTATSTERYEQAQRNAANATDEVTVSMDKVQGKAGGVGSSLVEMGTRAGLFAHSMIAIGSAADIAMTALEDARLGDKLAAQLGAPADMAADLGRVAGNLYAQAYGESLDQVNEAIRGVMQSGLVMEDATGDQIQAITAKVLNLATAFDQDLGDATQAVGQLMKTGLAKDADEALDVLTRGFQQGADRSKDLLDTMTEYSVQFAKFGLDATMATGLLVQGMQAGARNSDLVADAIKEFSIRAVDGSKLTAQGFKDIGLNAAQMAATIGKGGPEASAALGLVLDKLRGIKDPVAQSQAAVALFGTQAEDLGQALYALDPSNAVQALGEVGGAADRMGAVLNDSAGSRLIAFQRTVQTDLVNFFGGVVLPTLTNAVQWVKDNADWLAPLAVTVAAFAAGYGAVSGALKLYELATKGAAAAQWLLNVAMDANPIGLVVGAIVAVVAAFAYFWQTSAGFRDFWIGVWRSIQDAAVSVWRGALEPAFDGIVAALRVVGQIASWLWTTVLSPVFSFIGHAAGVLAAIVATVLVGPFVVAFQLITTTAQWLWTNAIQPVFGAIGAFIGWIWTTLIKPYFDGWVFVFGLLASGATWLWTNAIQPAFTGIATAAGWLWTTILQPYFQAWLFLFGKLGDGASWLWSHAIKPAWDAISGAVSWAYDHVIKPVFDWFREKIDDVGTAFHLMQDVIKRVFDAIADFVKKPIQLVIDVVWNNGLRKVYNAAAALIPGVDELPELKLARGGVIPGYAPGQDTVSAMLSPGEAVLVPELVRAIGPGPILAANAAAMAGRRYSRGGLVPGFAGGGIVTGSAGGTTAPNSPTSAGGPDPGASTAATDALTAASLVLADAINTVVVPALVALETQLGVLLVSADSALAASTGQLQAVLGASWAAISALVWNSATSQNNAFGALANGLGALRGAVGLTATWVRDRFLDMQGYAANPVRWILQWPFNAGLVAAWNTLDADFALNKHIGNVPIAFATGGTVPGTGDSDTVPALLTPGEYVLPKKVVAKWGVGNIRAAHLAALSSGAFPGLNGLLGDDMAKAQEVRRYAVGGYVADTGSANDAALARGQQFARSMSGKPYVWGGNSTAGTDCSGYMGAIARVLVGLPPFPREWATGSVGPNQPPPHFTDGIDGAFAIGVSRGHTAGTLAGVNVESGGSHGNVLYGPPSAGADDGQFPWKFHLPQVGGTFVSGGGAGFDPAAVASAAFAETYRMADAVTSQFPGNVMAAQGQGVARRSADAARDYAVGCLSALYSASSGSAGSADVVAAVRAVASRYGWGTGPEWDALSWVISHESGWNPNAANPHSSARGLFQKMTSTHGPIEPTVAGQAEWGLGYISSRYGDPLGAKAFWAAHHWYDNGGWLQPGFTPVYNGTGKPEMVLTNGQANDVMAALRDGQGSDKQVVINIYPQPGQSERSIAEAVSRRLQLAGRT